MKIDKETARLITSEITSGIELVLKKHGMTLAKTRSTYGDKYSIKIEAELQTAGPNGVNMTSVEATDYSKYYASYDLPSGLLGKKFTVQGKEYAFAGIATRRSKFPICARDLEEGKTVFFKDTAKKLLVDCEA